MFLFPLLMMFIFGVVGAADNRSEPGRSVLLDGTRPEYYAGKGASGQSIKPCLLVYKSGSAPDNEVTLCSAMYGSSFEDEATIYVVEIPRSHPSFPKSWDKSTAFTALTDGFRMHRLKVGDRIWLNGSSLSLDETDMVACAASGTVIQYASTTIDKWNVHTFKIIGTWSTATWVQGEYVGRMPLDES